LLDFDCLFYDLGYIMSDTWVVSDTHFRHGAILTFKDYAGKAPRDGFTNADHMDRVIMDNWNSVVKPNDTVYHLGDVLFGEQKDKWLSENFSRLNGKKHLILGNHDNPKLLSPYFASIALWKELPKLGLILSHTPLHKTTLAETHRFGTGNILNVHGHIHSNPSPAGPYKCVCVEQINYTPVNVEELSVV
jgi:calcineurin-like phosphoesterase family protein